MTSPQASVQLHRTLIREVEQISQRAQALEILQARTDSKGDYNTSSAASRCSTVSSCPPSCRQHLQTKQDVSWQPNMVGVELGSPLTASISFSNRLLYHRFCMSDIPTYKLISFFGNNECSTSDLTRRSKKGRRTLCNWLTTCCCCSSDSPLPLNQASKSSLDEKTSGGGTIPSH
jgi:hypothetical protein